MSKLLEFKKNEWRQVSGGLMALAALAVLLAGWGFIATDVWLASTQWLLVAGVLAIFGLYARMES